MSNRSINRSAQSYFKDKVKQLVLRDVGSDDKFGVRLSQKPYIFRRVRLIRKAFLACCMREINTYTHQNDLKILHLARYGDLEI